MNAEITTSEQIPNDLGTKVEKKRMRTLMWLRKSLTPHEKKKLSKRKKVSLRLIEYILAEKRKDTINLRESANKLIDQRKK